jgi:hypothetical protein
MQARVARALERRDRARAQDAVLPDQRSVEVGRDDGRVAREVGRELDQPPAPCVES